jgi:hypothetical protein
MTMDISETTAPKSDQQQYDDYLGGKKRTVTISNVTKGTPEQPVNVELEEFPGRPFRPNKTMRRLLVLAWGADSSAYIGRRLELFGNPAVVFGGKAVGGVEIAAMSHIDKPLTVALTATRGKRRAFTVQPLAANSAPKDTSGRDWISELDLAGEDLDAITALGTAASAAHAEPTVLAAIRGEYQRVKAQAATPDA